MSKYIFIVAFCLGFGFYAHYQFSSIQDISSSEPTLKALPSSPFFDASDSPSPVDSGSKGLVHFWATWCGPCEKELPDLIALFRKLPDVNLYMVAVNDKVAEVDKFLKRFGELPSNIVVLYDNREVHRTSYGTYKLPESFLFLSGGKIDRKFVGPQDWARPVFLRMLSTL